MTHHSTHARPPAPGQPPPPPPPRGRATRHLARAPPPHHPAPATTSTPSSGIVRAAAGACEGGGPARAGGRTRCDERRYRRRRRRRGGDGRRRGPPPASGGPGCRATRLRAPAAQVEGPRPGPADGLSRGLSWATAERTHTPAEDRMQHLRLNGRPRRHDDAVLLRAILHQAVARHPGGCARPLQDALQ